MNNADEPQNTPPAAPAPKSRGLGERVVKATVAIAAAHAMAKALGVIQWSVISYYFASGTGVVDAFFLTYEGIIYSLFLIGEESLGPAFLPVFMESREKDGEKDAWRFTSTLLNLQFMLLVVVVAGLMLFPDAVIGMMSKFDDQDGGTIDRAKVSAEFLWMMAPTLLGLSLGSLTYMILNGYKKFFWPAFADAGLKAGLMAGIVLGRQAGLEDNALVAGILAAGAAKIGIHLLALGGKLKLWRPALDLSHPRLRKFLILVAPLLVGIVFAKVRDYYNNFYILSNLEPGLLAANAFGRKIFNAMGQLIPYPLSIAIFPFMCEMVARDNKEELAKFLTHTSRMLLMFFMPVTAVLVLLAVPLAQALFEGGQTGAETAGFYGKVSVYYTLVLPAIALEMIFMQAFFSTYRTASVTVIGIVFSALSMIISYVGVVAMGIGGEDAIVVVALGYTISRWLKSLTLIGVQRAMGLRILPLAQTVPFLARVAVLTAACFAAAYGTLEGVNRVMPPAPAEVAQPPSPAEAEAGEPPNDAKDSPKPKPVSKKQALIKAAPRLALPGIVAALVFLLGCKLLRFEEFDEMLAFAREKLKRRGTKKDHATKPDDGAGAPPTDPSD